LLLARNEVEEKNDMWFLDSRASNHMCGKKELFSDIDEIKVNVSLVNSTKLDVQDNIHHQCILCTQHEK
jgi:predicted xylose isomerase-like sugar epimerase